MTALKKIIAQICPGGIDADKIGRGTDLVVDLGYDSVALIQLVVEIEIQLGVTLDDEELVFDIISQYDELEKLILRKQAGGMASDDDETS